MSAGAGYGFVYHDASSLLGLAISLGVIDAIAVALRFLARKRQNVSYWIDDWLSVAALITLWGCVINIIVGTASHALGYPTPDIDESAPDADTMVNTAIKITSQCEWVTSLLSVVTLGLIKLSFLFFLRRIFCPTGAVWSTVSIVTWTLIAGVIAWTITFFFGWLFICRGDFSAYWGPYAGLLEHCGKAYPFLVGTAVTDAIFDIIIVLLPLPLIWTLRLSISKKIAVSGVFLVGLLIIAASLARMVLVLRSSSASVSVDEDLYISNYVWWTMFEVGLAMLGSCMISLRPLVSDFTDGTVLESLKSALRPSNSGRSLRDLGKEHSHDKDFIGHDGRDHDAVPTYRADIEYSADRQTDRSS